MTQFPRRRRNSVFIEHLLDPLDKRDLKLIRQQRSEMERRLSILNRYEHSILQRAKLKQRLNEGWRPHPATRLPAPSTQKRENEHE